MKLEGPKQIASKFDVVYKLSMIFKIFLSFEGDMLGDILHYFISSELMRLKSISTGNCIADIQ